MKKELQKKIGTVGGCELHLVGNKEQIEFAKRLLGKNEYIYFDGYEGGHHPSFPYNPPKDR